jgi:hypothetical protein
MIENKLPGAGQIVQLFKHVIAQRKLLSKKKVQGQKLTICEDKLSITI